MTVATRHFLEQGPAVAALARTALSAVGQSLWSTPAAAPRLPGPLVQSISPPPSAELARDFVLHLGGNPDAYRDQLPPHLFSQWALPLAAQTLAGVPYPLLRVVNGGCRLVCNGPLPLSGPLHHTAQLVGIDDNGRRAVLHQHLTSGPSDQPDALVADLYAIVPLGGGKSAPGEAKPAKEERPSVPIDARQLDVWHLDADAGYDFAKLTGDLNPIHWIPAYARMSGFRSVILHGFGTMARAFEGLVQHVCDGNPAALRELDVRFTRPLVLPASVGLYVQGNDVFVGDAAGGPAYLVGTFATA